jgi:hypothetical protein
MKDVEFRYHLSSFNVETEGELYIFKVSKTDIKKMVDMHMEPLKSTDLLTWSH